MALMIERDTSPRLDDDDFVLPSDDELTEWSEDADALDSLTELWTEDQ